MQRKIETLEKNIEMMKESIKISLDDIKNSVGFKKEENKLEGGQNNLFNLDSIKQELSNSIK